MLLDDADSVFLVQNGGRRLYPLLWGSSFLTLDGTREAWDAGELLPLISPSPPQYLSQAGDEPGQVPAVPKYAAEMLPAPPPHCILLSKNLKFPACISLLWT